MAMIRRFSALTLVIVCAGFSRGLHGQAIDNKPRDVSSEDDKSQLAEATQLAGEAMKLRLAGKTAEALASAKQALVIR